jgi:hypothetical protein
MFQVNDKNEAYFQAFIQVLTLLIIAKKKLSFWTFVCECFGQHNARKIILTRCSMSDQDVGMSENLFSKNNEAFRNVPIW